MHELREIRDDSFIRVTSWNFSMSSGVANALAVEHAMTSKESATLIAVYLCTLIASHNRSLLT
jgi:hypothetical protein